MKNEHGGTEDRVLRPGVAHWTITRRDFLKASGGVLAGAFAGLPCAWADEAGRKPKLRFGLVTDAHYADADARGGRNYRGSVAKMTECVALMNEQKVAFLVELGDFKDQGAPAAEKNTLAYLDAIEKVFRRFEGPRYHVLGNHDTDSIAKEQFLALIENTGIARESKYYAFDSNGLHFVVLDANYNADGSDYDHGKFKWTEPHVPEKELAWLKAELAAAAKPVIVFVHQQLDGDDIHCVRNAAQVRQILQESRKVLAVFQGHYHEGAYTCIEGIHYYTLKAMLDGSGVEGSSYAIVEVADDGSLVVIGYRQAVSRKLAKA